MRLWVKEERGHRGGAAGPEGVPASRQLVLQGACEQDAATGQLLKAAAADRPPRRPSPGSPKPRTSSRGERAMPQPDNVKVDPAFPVPDTMKAWVLGDPGELSLVDKPVPVPKRAEVLVRIDGVAVCATDLEIIAHGPPAQI